MLLQDLDLEDRMRAPCNKTWENPQTLNGFLAVWFGEEIDSVQYDTAQRFRKRKKKITKILTKNKNIFTHKSVAQAGSNDDKTWFQKSLWTVTLNPNLHIVLWIAEVSIMYF